MTDNSEYLDDDEYPTEEAIRKIEAWEYSCDKDFKEFFEFLESIWYLKSWGWLAEEFTKNNQKGIRYHISTAGWSGNESLIKAFERNECLWYTTWVSSRRGGHYVFEFIFEGD